MGTGTVPARMKATKHLGELFFLSNLTMMLRLG